jgi:Na+/melibiose symporter-like transporter
MLENRCGGSQACFGHLIPAMPMITRRRLSMESFLLLAFIALWILLFVFWVKMLINAAETKDWAWFILMIVFSFLAFVYYFVAYVSPEDQRTQEKRRRDRRRNREYARDEEMARMKEELRALKEGRGAE